MGKGEQQPQRYTIRDLYGKGLGDNYLIQETWGLLSEEIQAKLADFLERKRAQNPHEKENRLDTNPEVDQP